MIFYFILRFSHGSKVWGNLEMLSSQTGIFGVMNVCNG